MNSPLNSYIKNMTNIASDSSSRGDGFVTENVKEVHSVTLLKPSWAGAGLLRPSNLTSSHSSSVIAIRNRICNASNGNDNLLRSVHSQSQSMFFDVEKQKLTQGQRNRLISEIKPTPQRQQPPPIPPRKSKSNSISGGSQSSTFALTKTKVTKPQFWDAYGDNPERNCIANRTQRLLNHSIFSTDLFRQFYLPNEMGWTQPIVGVGKRVRESDENENNGGSGNGGSCETDHGNSNSDDMKGTFVNKKPREISPKRSPGLMMDYGGNMDASFAQRMPLSLMSMGCGEFSNRPGPSLTSEPMTNGTLLKESGETDICQGNNAPASPSQYSFHHPRPEFGVMRRSRERSVGVGGDDPLIDPNPSLKALSISDQTSTSSYTTTTEEDSEVELHGNGSFGSSMSTSPTLKGVRVARRGGRLIPGSRGSNFRGGYFRKPHSKQIAHASDSSTTCTSSASTESSEGTSEATEAEAETDFDDKTDDYAEDEGDLSDTATEFEPADDHDQVPSNVVPAIRPSYFPNVPPYINFCLHDEQCEELPAEIKKCLKWRLSPITPNIIKKTVSNTGFRLLKKTVEWNGQWGKHMKAAVFRSSLKDYQKLNHLPATFQIGRKDRLWRNFHRLMVKFGREEFGFLPRTYILPQEMKQLKQAWDASDSKGKPWIIKPPAGARGTGIRVVNKWAQVPKKRPVIVQKYISNPLLINERKFDLRLYVLVTSFHPLKIYMYNDGLVRFAPVKYSHDTKRVSDRFMHLTNYSVNKNCELYTQNEDADSCSGHKWTLKTLWRHLRSEGTNTDQVWEQIQDIVIKTLLCAEDAITAAALCLPNRYNGYELFGFDIILDQQLKPWLLEVNISPSLHSSSPLDLTVKGKLVREVFNIVGYHLPDTLSASAKKSFVQKLDVALDQDNPTFDKRLYCGVISKEEKAKHHTFNLVHDVRNKYIHDIIKTLTPSDLRQLITSEDELSQCRNFTRIFPTTTSHTYFPFIDGARYYNLLLDAWETAYHRDRAEGIARIQEMCKNKIHLQVTTSSKNPISENPSPTSASPPPPVVVAEKLKDNLGPFEDEGHKRIKDKYLNGSGDGVRVHDLDNNILYCTPPSVAVNCHDEASLTTNPSPGTDFTIKGVC